MIQACSVCPSSETRIFACSLVGASPLAVLKVIDSIAWIMSCGKFSTTDLAIRLCPHPESKIHLLMANTGLTAFFTLAGDAASTAPTSASLSSPLSCPKKTQRLSEESERPRDDTVSTPSFPVRSPEGGRSGVPGDKSHPVPPGGTSAGPEAPSQVVTLSLPLSALCALLNPEGALDPEGAG